MRLLLLSFILLSSSIQSGEAFSIEFNKIEKQKLSLSSKHFIELLDWSLSLRQRTIFLFRDYKEQKRNKIPFTGSQILTIKNGVKEHQKLRQEIFLLINSFRSSIENEHATLLNSQNLSKTKLLVYCAAITLYDNYQICLSSLASDSDLRRLIDKENKSLKITGNTLSDIMKSYHSRSQRKKIRTLKEDIVTHQEHIKAMSKTDPQVSILKSLIEQSPADKIINDSNFLFDYSSYFKVFGRKGYDSFKDLRSHGSNSFSKIFGNTIGLVQTRHGKLYQQELAKQSIRKKLKPLDILLEKTPFRLTDKLIPGYYGHVAIWLGTEKELKELKLWNHPFIKPHQESIRQGKSVLEALRHGVVLNDLDHFMDVDDFASLRHKNLDETKTQETLLRCFLQIGKEYDFNFDVETLDKIVCSEIVYHTFLDLKWPTESTLGRATISPDNVACKALHDAEFQPVILYVDGKVCQHSLAETYAKLLQDED
mgnify:CR=1 FL=1